MNRFLTAISSAIPAILFSWTAGAAEPPGAVPSAAAPPNAAPAPAAYAPPVQPAYAPLPPPGAVAYPYARPVQMDESPPDSYDVRYPRKSAGIFVHPLALLTGVFGAELDLKMTSAVTMNLGANYTKGSFSSIGHADADAWAIDVGPQIFPFGRAFNQLYIYPRLSYGHAWATVSDSTSSASATATAFGFATTVGYQWTYESGFSLRLGAGVAYITAHAEDDKATTQLQLSGIFPAADASLGWTF